MSEFENVVPYTQAELDQQEIWAKEFDQWWGSEGQYHRAGGNDYCRTFAWFAWLSREQSKQSEIDQLKAEKAGLEGRIHDLEFYVRQFLDVLASNHEPHKDALPKLLSHLNHLVNSEDAVKALRGEHETG